MPKDLAALVRTIPDFPEPGIRFKDFTPLLADVDARQQATRQLLEPFREHDVTKVIGIESRGFILGSEMATVLEAGFVPIRKAGKLPAATHAEEYELEYGTDVLEMHRDSLEEHDRVLIHDDVLATGGTLAAACRLVARSGAELVGCSVLIELTALGGREALPPDVELHAVLQMAD